MDKNKKYFAFISYKSEDVEWAIWLQHELEHYHLPASYNGRTDVRQNLRPIFRDIDELSAGNLPQQIHQALVDSQNLIVVCSPKSATSPWVNQEIETFIALGRTDYIFPFIVEGNSPKDFFPPSLLTLPSDQERLGGDVSKNGRDAAFIKIVAGMLNLGFDSLWNRYEKEKAEQERKQREEKERLQIIQSRFVSEKAHAIIKDGDAYLAMRLLLEVVPDDLKNPNRPMTIDAEKALRAAYQDNSAILRGHTNEVNTVEFSPDGKFIISASKDSTIRIWNAFNGKLFKLLSGHTKSVNIAKYSPNGKWIASASDDTMVRIWNATDGALFFCLNHEDPVSHVDFNCKGDKIITVSYHNISIWDFKTQTCIKRFDRTSANESFIYASFSPNEEYIVSLSLYSHKIHIWDVAEGCCIRTIKHNTNILAISFNPTGDKIASVSLDGVVSVWNTFTGKKLLSWKTPTNPISASIQYSSDGKKIITAMDGPEIYIWEASTGKYLTSLFGHLSDVNYCSFDKEVKRVVSASKDNSIRLWTISNLLITDIESLFPYAEHIDISSDAKTIVVANENRVKIIDIINGLIKENIINEQNFQSLTFAPNYTHFSTTSIRTIKTPKPSWLWRIRKDRIAKQLLQKYPDGISCSNNSLRDSITWYIKKHGSICVWNIKTGESIIDLKGKEYSISTISYDGRKIACVSDDGSVDILDITTGELLTQIYCPKAINTITFSPDGTMLVCGSHDSYVFVKNIVTGENIYTLEGHHGTITSLIYSADGKFIASAASDTTIRIWDTGTGELLSILEGHSQSINFINFNTDLHRQLLVSTSKDRTIRVWDVEMGCCILNIHIQDSHAKTIFSSDGRLLISVTKEGGVKIWRFPTTQELIDEVKSRFVNAQLIDEDRKMFYLW